MIKDWFSLAQCTGYIAFVLGVGCFLQKEDRRFKLFMAGECLAYIVHFASLGNPTAGQLGTIQRLAFDGPKIFTVDMGISKRFRFGNRYFAEVRGEMFNAFNHPIFEVADLDVNSTTFGRATTLEVGARVVQLAVKFNF